MSRVLDSRRVLVYTFNQVVECHRVRMVGVGVAIAQPHGVDAENAAPDTRRIARITARTKIEGRLYFELGKLTNSGRTARGAAPEIGNAMTHIFKKETKAPIVLVALVSMLALAGCTSTSGGSTSAGSAGATNSRLQQVIKSGTLKVGVLPDYPPYSLQDASGKIVGYEPDIAAHLAAALGVKLVMINTDGTSRKPVLDSNRVDVDIDAFTATDVRAKAVDFTIPYVASGALPLFRKVNTIKSLADLKGKKVSVARGSTNDSLMTKQFPDTTVVRFDTIADAGQAVKSGKVDAVMEGFATVQAAAAKDPSLGVLNVEPISPALISMGVKQGDQVWVNYLNNFIRNLNSSGVNLDPLWSALIALTINNGAYVAEILRAGFDSVPSGLREAAHALGMNSLQTFRYVVFTPGIRKVFPAMTNQFILLFLFSSVASVIALPELTNALMTVNSNTLRTFEVFTFGALLYYAVSSVLAIGSRVGEKRLFRW